METNPLTRAPRRSEVHFTKLKGREGEVAYLDKNGNGTYDPGQDRLIVVDLNGDQNRDHSEAAMTARLLRHQARQGTLLESLDPEAKGLHAGLDRNGDGKLTNEELGGRITLVNETAPGGSSGLERIDALVDGEVDHHWEIPYGGFGPGLQPDVGRVDNPHRPLVLVPDSYPFNPFHPSNRPLRPGEQPECFK